MNTVPQTPDDPYVLPEHTKELCQLRWLDDALSPLSFFEEAWRFGMRRVRGLRRRSRVLARKLGLAAAAESRPALTGSEVAARTESWAPGNIMAAAETGAGDADPSSAPAGRDVSDAGEGDGGDGRPPQQQSRGAKLREGDLVQVKSPEEIRATLDESRKHEGLKFLPPMREHCGKVYRVQKRVRYILDEHDHRMRKVKNVVLLDGVICKGKGIYGREDCDRSCFFFWKDAWLRKLEG